MRDAQTRLWVMPRAGDDGLPEIDLAGAKVTCGHGTTTLTVRAIKWTMDGALGSHGPGCSSRCRSPQYGPRDRSMCYGGPPGAMIQH